MTIIRQNIALVATSQKIEQPISKFGGQPNWVADPQWPVSRSLEKPMSFIGQIQLSDTKMSDLDGKVAYLFMTNDESVDTYEFEAGENAVIIQSGNSILPNLGQESGPTFSDKEYAFELTQSEDPDFISENDRMNEDDEDADCKYLDSLEGMKIGGTPGFYQSDEFPNDDLTYRLLMQFSEVDLPFNMCTADDGAIYAFISADGNTGKMFWQC